VPEAAPSVILHLRDGAIEIAAPLVGLLSGGLERDGFDPAAVEGLVRDECSSQRIFQARIVFSAKPLDENNENRFHFHWFLLFWIVISRDTVRDRRAEHHQ